MIAAAIAVLVVAGIAAILARRQLAELQSMLAGGTLLPGCVVAEGIAILLLAAIVAVAAWMGLLK